VEQLQLLNAPTSKAVAVPVGARARSEIDLMARILVAVFPIQGERVMNQALYHPKRLQYDVAERMRDLGWKYVEVIDDDLGCSAGLAAARRGGFERVLSSVALGEVGIVGSWEVSRLSRTDKDWCRLLEVCQIFGTLIADEQHIYDLSSLDDQLVSSIVDFENSSLRIV
jgi:DNA invertase Pin-like site-specific DNA recombinase